MNRYFAVLLALLLFGALGFSATLTIRGEDAPESFEAEADPEQEAAAEDVMPPEGESPNFTPLNPKWTAPNYAGQERALGWTPEAFRPPAGMEERVQFWKDIYTKYSSNQGVLHDSKYVHLVYEMVDFNDISQDEQIGPREREKRRRKRVDAKKKEIADRLKRLQDLKDGEGLEGEDLRYWEMFQKVDEPKKFIEAARKGRLRFQLGQRDIFIRGIYQSGRYLRQMEEIFRQEGLPIELTRMPFVESSFNLRARSKVGASGIWQFMRSTARLYMRMDPSADERNDPLRATRAAAKKLRYNYSMLNALRLAVTAYNHGPHGVKRLTQKMGTTDIVELIDVRKGRFGFASASFYASFLAALDVEANADKHFGLVEVMPELRGAEIQLIKSVKVSDIMKWFDGNQDLAKMLNPHVVDAFWQGKRPLSPKHFLRVPVVLESQARSELQ